MQPTPISHLQRLQLTVRCPKSSASNANISSSDTWHSHIGRRCALLASTGCRFWPQKRWLGSVLVVAKAGSLWARSKKPSKTQSPGIAPCFWVRSKSQARGTRYLTISTDSVPAAVGHTAGQTLLGLGLDVLNPVRWMESALPQGSWGFQEWPTALRGPTLSNDVPWKTTKDWRRG